MRLAATLVLLCCQAAAVWARNATAARIAFGTQAPKAAFPYVAHVNMGERQCSGVVVGPRWVLTAAHCGMGSPPLAPIRVRLGAASSRTGPKLHRVRRMVLPGTFDAGTLYGDVMLLELDTPTRVTPVRLPRGAAASEPLEDGFEVTAMGWGSTESLMFPDRLSFVAVAYAGTGDCARGLQESGPKDHLCFASLTKDGRATCRGDSGGPFLWFTGEGAPTLVGTTSYGPDVPCGDKTNYDVATSTYYWAEWIAQTMATATAERNSKQPGTKKT